jgi:hypothetical protein
MYLSIVLSPVFALLYEANSAQFVGKCKVGRDHIVAESKVELYTLSPKE